MRRRRFLALAGGGTLALAGGVAVDNVLLGYGPVTGTNLLEQDVESLANERLGPLEGRPLDVGETTLSLRADGLSVAGETLPWTTSWATLRRAEREHGLPDGALVQLATDVPALWDGDHAVEPLGLEAFFERVADAEPRPYTVAALRGPRVRDVAPSLVEAFADVDPADPREVAYGLVDGFRGHTFFDVPRYVAGAVEDNVLRGRADLRGPFESPTDFRAMLDGENAGAFCYELSNLAIEAFHAVSAPEQAVPVVGAYVRDARHKHVFTGLATVLSEGPTLALTFLDYTPTTAAHSFGVTPAIGDDPNAYTARHRATDVLWNRRTHG
jgi:hypothetical protein